MQEPMNDEIVPSGLSFESIKKLNEHGIEYWSARDLQPYLGYSKWQRFENAIEKAMESCKRSGNNPKHHFTGAGKQIEFGKGSIQRVEDYHLSRFACYLIAQNGDPRKPEIAQAQKYFAIQTRRQELSDEEAADRERLEMREQASIERSVRRNPDPSGAGQDELSIKGAEGVLRRPASLNREEYPPFMEDVLQFKALSGAARNAGVQDKMFGLFHDAGYKGLYGGSGVDAIKARKGINPKEQLMDRMNTTELSANQFRMTHTREKLKMENIKNPRDAMVVHEAVGKEVRAAIVKIGVALPENIPAAEPIKNVKKRLKASKPLLTLEPKDATGLISPDSTKK